MTDEEFWAPTTPEPLRMTVSLEHKLGLPDYSSVAGFMSIHITSETTDEEIAAMVNRGRVAYDLMGPAVTAKAREARQKQGWG